LTPPPPGPGVAEWQTGRSGAALTALPLLGSQRTQPADAGRPAAGRGTAAPLQLRRVAASLEAAAVWRGGLLPLQGSPSWGGWPHLRLGSIAGYFGSPVSMRFGWSTATASPVRAHGTLRRPDTAERRSFAWGWNLCRVFWRIGLQQKPQDKAMAVAVCFLSACRRPTTAPGPRQWQRAEAGHATSFVDTIYAVTLLDTHTYTRTHTHTRTLHTHRFEATNMGCGASSNMGCGASSMAWRCAHGQGGGRMRPGIPWGQVGPFYDHLS
jgi:hypothetical protein